MIETVRVMSKSYAGQIGAVVKVKVCFILKIDLESPLQSQGTFDGFLHKLTDVIAKADQGDLEVKKC